jgi:aspartyl-tRNA(Asn)/glutamyl-tRNA(Gln) amidotransferase subunit A
VNPFAALAELAGMLARGEASSVELTRAFLARIDRLDPALHAFVGVRREQSLEAARASDARRAAGRCRGPLDGLPLALKDLCEIEGEVTTFGSQAWTGRRSEVTSAVVERLQAQGMVFLGKTHMVEFAFGTTGTNPLMGTPRNPWDRAAHRVPGGSSSGSGVAVAAGLAPAALGSDTGGSIRIPASLLGITGLKPTASRVSLRGVLPLSPTLDSVGPMTRSVDDAALLFAAMAGDAGPGGPAGAAAHEAPSSATAHASTSPAGVRGLRYAVVPDEQLPLETAPEVVRALRDFTRFLQDGGGVRAEVPFPLDFDGLGRRCRNVIAAEAWRIHAAYIEDASLPIGPHVRQRVRSGSQVTAAAHAAELAERAHLCAQWNAAMTGIDLLLAPTLPCVAMRVDEVDEASPLLGAFTRAVNYIGGCALSLPAGFSPTGLPTGMQLIAAPGREDVLLQAGRAWQRATDWHLRTPPGWDAE